MNKQHENVKYSSATEQELTLYHGWFWAYFRTLVGQFEVLLGTLVPHLRRQTTNHQPPIAIPVSCMFCQGLIGRYYHANLLNGKHHNVRIVIVSMLTC